MTVWDWVAGVFGAFGLVLVLIIFGGYLADVRDHRRRERNRLQTTIKQLEHVADIGFGPGELFAHTICVRGTTATLLCLDVHTDHRNHVQRELPGQWLSPLTHSHIHLDGHPPESVAFELQRCDQRSAVGASTWNSAGVGATFQQAVHQYHHILQQNAQQLQQIATQMGAQNTITVTQHTPTAQGNALPGSVNPPITPTPAQIVTQMQQAQQAAQPAKPAENSKPDNSNPE